MSLSTSSPNITQDIKVSPVGKTIIIPQTVTINSNNPHGIKLFISSKDDKLVPTKTTPVINTSTPISPVPGDIITPSTLNINSFGFALPNESDNPLSSNFSNNNIYTSNDKNLKNTAKFSKLTNKQNPIEIYQNKSTTTNKQLTVYYGTKINSVIDKGTYTLDILYTLIPNLAGANTTPGQNNQEALTIAESDNNTLELTPAKLTKAQGGENLTIKVNASLSNYNSVDLNVNAYINNKQCNNTIIETLNPISIKCTTPPNNPGKYDLKLNISTKSGKVLINFSKKNAVEYIEVTDMQSFTPAMCKNMQEHDAKYVKDTRDNEIYTIAKLKDQKCWMTQNLRLKLSTSTTLTPADTDIASSWTPPRSTKENSGSGGSSGYGEDERWNNDSEGYKTVRSIYRTPTYNTHGVYYTHSAVTAQSANNIDTQGQNAPHSICPKGWRLPTSSSSSGQGDYWNMVRHYTGNNNSWTNTYSGSHTLISGTPSFPLPGLYGYGGYFYIVDSNGYFWSSTVSSSGNAYDLHQNSFNLNPHDYSHRYDGFSARCVAREPKDISEITYMQDMESGTCDKMTEHQTATLTDKRDGQQYTIAKLKDKKCWMTQNLRLKLSTSKTLTPADTDIASNWTPPRSTKENSGSGGEYGQGGDERWDGDSEGSKTVRSIYRTPTYSTHGVYYTHSAVTAGSANNIDTDGQNAPHSICPKGWRPPIINPSIEQVGYFTSIYGEYWNMVRHYTGSNNGWSYGSYSGSHTLISGTPSFPLSGRYDDDGYFYGVGSLGRFWSSTVASSGLAHGLYQESSSLTPRMEYSRYGGLSARCVAR